MKLNAPANSGGFSVGETEYTVDEHGQIEVEDPTHVADLLRLGATYPETERKTPDEGSPVAPIPSTDDELQANHDTAVARVADLEQENEDLKLKLADAVRDLGERDAEIERLREAPGGTAEQQDTATGGDTTGDQAGDAGEAKDDAAKPEAPNLDEMSRDEMVEWLRANGVVVSPSIAKAAARAAIEDKLSGE